MQEKILDYRGEECPTPLIKVARVIADIKEETKIIILTNVEECVNLLKETLEAFKASNIETRKMNSYWSIEAIIDYRTYVEAFQ